MKKIYVAAVAIFNFTMPQFSPRVTKWRRPDSDSRHAEVQ